ncbi:hypothetical protein AAK938_01295 [Aerococcaceae bacterium 50-4]
MTEPKKTAQKTTTKQEPKYSKAGLVASGEFSAIEQDILIAILPNGEMTIKEAKSNLENYKKGAIK